MTELHMGQLVFRYRENTRSRHDSRNPIDS